MSDNKSNKIKIFRGSILGSNINYNYTLLSNKPRSFKTSRLNIITHKTNPNEIQLVIKNFHKIKNEPNKLVQTITLNQDELINLLAHLALENKNKELSNVLKLSAFKVIDTENED